MLDCLMHGDTLERLSLGQTDCAMLLRVLKGQQCRAQQGRMRQVRMTIGKGAEFDHIGMLPQSNQLCQNQKNPLDFS